jgi:glycogen debranching enzyme
MSCDPLNLWKFALRHLRLLRQPYGFSASEGTTGIYNALFGRDSLWTLLFLLEAQGLVTNAQFEEWLEAVSGNIIDTLISHQGERCNDTIEEQPGKIIHEYREELDERLREMGIMFEQGRSYAGFDQTFLFVIAVASLARNSRFISIVNRAWSSFDFALDWIERRADQDGDGFFEYERRDERNLLHQSWRDSFDSVTVGGVDIPKQPIAWLSVQAYAYMAFTEAAALYECRNESKRAEHFRARANALKRNVNISFWVPQENCYAVGLDGKKRIIPMVTSDASHALWAGLPGANQHTALINRLLRGDMTTSYGLRTLSSLSTAYCPFAYHRGNIWPFDNAVFVMGLIRERRLEEAIYIIEGVAAAINKIGTPVELYIALDGGLFVEPMQSMTKHVLLVRHENQQNRVQSWTAAALAYMAAALAKLRGTSLELRDDWGTTS